MSVKDFRVGTFNCYNLVREGVPYYSKEPYSHDEFEEKTAWIAGQLDRMGVDIVGFQEVFHKDALREAFLKSKIFAGVEPVMFGTDVNEDYGEKPVDHPLIAFGSRFEVTAQASIADFPDDAPVSGLAVDDQENIVTSREFSRPVLRARVKITDDLSVTLFVVHLKSKWQMYDKGESADNPLHRAVGSARALIQRSAEAAGLRSLVLSEVKETRTPVIVMGDFNDGSLAVTTQMVAGDKPYYRWGTEKKEPYWDILLYAIEEIHARNSTRDVYFTHIYNGFYEALDHILVSEEFYGLNPDRVGKVEYVHILNDHVIDETQAFEGVPRTRSDHGQVVAKISILEDGGE